MAAMSASRLTRLARSINRLNVRKRIYLCLWMYVESSL